MKDTEAREGVAQVEASVARLNGVLDSLSRQVALMPAQLASTMNEMVDPTIIRFNAAMDRLDASAHMTKQLVDQVAHLTATVKGLMEHDNMLGEELDSIRTTVTKLDKNVGHMKNTFAMLGKSA